MNQTQTATAVSKNLGISTRMLRYYEQAGLITSQRMQDYAYRVYDETAIERLRQIIILRKLRVPIKQIREIFGNSNAASIIEVFERNINELDSEITALSTVKSILSRLVQELCEKANLRLQLDYLSDSSVYAIVGSLSFSKNTLQEEKTIDDLHQASQQLERLADQDVRIVYLPPATVLSHHAVGYDEQGREPEDFIPPLDAFVKALATTKPDFRNYGFDHNVGNQHGYEHWITIPDDMEVPPIFTKKHFPGGMYVASVWSAGNSNIDIFGLLADWAESSDKYEQANGSGKPMSGFLEENNMAAQIIAGVEGYIDLLLPIQPRKKKRKPAAQLGYISGSEEKCGYKASLTKKKGFTIAGYTNINTPGGISSEDFYTQFTSSGYVQRLKSALKPNAPLFVYLSYDGECVKASSVHGVFCYRQTVCADLNDIVDPDVFLTKDIFTQKMPPKRWVEFEYQKNFHKKFSENSGPHSRVKNLDWKFSGSGYLEVYNDGEIVINNDNKDNTMYCWMPVVPLK